MSTIEIVTERLSLRPFQVDDLEAFVAYRSDPEVARYQSWDSTYSMADAESFLRSQRELVFGQPGEWRQLAIVDRETGTVCGDWAVRVVTDQPATAEVGVTLAQANQGKGLATEALTAVVTERSSTVAYIESLLRPTIATFRSGVCSSAWASAARRAWSRPTGSRVSGRRCAFTRCLTGSGAGSRTRSRNNVHRLLVTFPNADACEPRPACGLRANSRLRVARLGDVIRDPDQFAARIEEGQRGHRKRPQRAILAPEIHNVRDRGAAGEGLREWLLFERVRRPIGAEPKYAAGAEVGKGNSLRREGHVKYRGNGGVVERDGFVCLHHEHARVSPTRQGEEHERLDVGREGVLVGDRVLLDEVGRGVQLQLVQ